MASEINLWSERQRLHFIERILYWRGYINRRDLVDFYGISPPQATNDLINYQTRNPGGCLYNVRKKRYEASPGMEMILLEPDFDADMATIHSVMRWEESIEFVLRTDKPQRVAPIGFLRALSLASHRTESLEMRYFSMHSGTAEWRRISPRCFGNDGLRWHVRAFCHKNQEFRDFNIGRINALRGHLPCAFAERVDAEWSRIGKMTIGVNPELSNNERKALEMDYGMKRGKLVFPVRAAMLTYAARRLGFTAPYSAGCLPMLNETRQLLWLDW
jgi:hypothetical protein